MPKYKPATVSHEEIKEEWFEVNAEGKRIGNVATKVAELLLAKHNPAIRDYLMPRTKVVIINADKIDATESRKIGKIYTNYSGFPGGLRKETLGEVLEKKPKKALERAVKGMLPKGRRGKAIYAKNLMVYAGPEHKHEAQSPVKVEIN